MINISNYLNYSLLFLIVINLQLFVAKGNIESDESEEVETTSKDAKSKIRCVDVLPDIKNGKYIIKIEANDYDHISLEFVCNEENFVLEPPIQTDHCFDGKWYHPAFPECLPICDYENWNSSWTKCVPDCGLRNQPDSSLTANELQLGDFPYHVGIYFKFESHNKDELKYVCGGSIISVRLVITAAYCVTHVKKGTAVSLNMYDIFIGAGKFYNGYDSALETNNAQKRQVVEFELENTLYYDKTSNYDNDLAILVVDEPFMYDNFIQPVCVDWFDAFNQDTYARKNHIGYVVGWGDNKYKASPALNIRLVTYILKITVYRETQSRDVKYITSKKICTNSEEGCDICVGDAGSGLVFARNIKGVTKYYIRNVVSGSGLDICGEPMTTRYAELLFSVDFLRKKLFEYPNIINSNASLALSKSTYCPVPFIPNGRLVISGNIYSSRKRIPNHSIVYIECIADTFVYPPFTKYIICQDGKFNTKVPKCSRKCPPLESETVEFTCELNGVTTNCTSPSFEGTIVTMICIQYHSNRLSDDQYAAAVCRDGVWDQPLLLCQPECSHRMFFTQVDIYETVTYDSDNPKGKYICGGSIISDDVILSAAQCFTNESNGELLNLESFSLHTRGGIVSIRKISDIKIPEIYKGKLSNFTGNLALLKLDKPLLLNISSIRIACFEEPLNYLEDLKSVNSRGGLVAGFVYTEDIENLKSSGFKPFDVYEHMTIAAYNLSECIYDVTKDIETSDKFCTGQLVGRSVPIYHQNKYLNTCFASPGAGYVTIGKDGLFKSYVQGVAGFHILNKTCTEKEEKYLFTAVEKHQPFLKSGIKDFSLCKIPDIKNSSFTIFNSNYSINDAIPNFSIIRVKCHKNFQIFPPFIDSILCNNGTYGQKLPYCILCGQIRQLNVQGNSTDGINEVEIPWQVEIYHNLTYKCAGTLITSRLIITNSLCFPDTVGDYQITVGNKDNDDSNFTQRQTVNKQDIKIKHDLALIILKNPIIFNQNVRPICLDWKDEFNYQEMTASEPGIVISTNINYLERKNENKTWKKQKFSDIDSSEMFLEEYEKPLMPNYFAAKTIEGPNTCLQNIGSGIAIKNKDGVYFLRGVMTSTTNESLTFCTFIKISYYLPFIINVVESI